MNAVTKNTKDYYDNAHTWSANIYTHAVIWRNWSLLIALLALIIAIISLVSLLKLFPLKENTPYLIFVDNKNGEPITIRPVSSNEFIENDHLKKYMIRKFITARERYNPNTLNDDRQTVAALSSDMVYSDYRYFLTDINNDSIFDVGGMNITFLNDQRAYVSFNLLVNEQGIIKQIPVSAQIKFHFAQNDLPMDAAQMINPVNFEVLSYQSHYQVNNEVGI